jgi:hypothetical protein
MQYSQQARRNGMPRYIVQRTFPAGLHIGVDGSGADLCRWGSRNELPVDQITQVRVLDPYFYA